MKSNAWLVALTLVAAPVFADPAVDAAAPARSEGWALGYTLGFTFGQRVGADIKDLDLDAFEQGMREAFAGKPGQLSEPEMQQAMEAFQQKRIAQIQAEQAQRAADNLAKSNEFLAKNGKRKGVKTTKSGLQYEVLAKGKGASPKPTDLVTAHYHGTFPDGAVFDSSRGGEPVEFPLDRVIPGWTEGVQLMKAGAKYKFYLPPGLAYGAEGIGEDIPPNQALVFEVELVSFRAAPPPSAEPAPEALDAQMPEEMPADMPADVPAQ